MIAEQRERCGKVLILGMHENHGVLARNTDLQVHSLKAVIQWVLHKTRNLCQSFARCRECQSHAKPHFQNVIVMDYRRLLSAHCASSLW